jgi:hypothetical protein
MAQQATDSTAAFYGISDEQFAEFSWLRRLVARLARWFPADVRLNWFGLHSGVVSAGEAAGFSIARGRDGRILFELDRGIVWTRGAHLDSSGKIVEELSPGINSPMAWWFIRRRRFLPVVIEEKGTVFSLVGDAAENLYHWSFDIMPRLALLDPEDLVRIRILAPQTRPFHQPSLTALGFREEQIIPAQSGAFYQTERLWLARSGGGVTKASVEFLREIYGGIVAQQPPFSKPVKLYISRSKATSRKIVNEQELEIGLEARGFRIVHFEDLTFPEQLVLMARADIIVSAHGAAWTLAVVARLGTPVIEILPEGLEAEDPASYHLYRSVCRETGLDYRAHHGEAVIHKSETQKTHQNDIRVSAEKLLAEIDEILSGGPPKRSIRGARWAPPGR